MSDDESEIREVEPGMTSLTRLPLEEAQLLVGRLESEGLKAMVFPEEPQPAIGGVLPMPALDSNLHDVLVETSRLDEARKIVADIDRE
jgi:putative signal transducing protein